jgi:hypothetical protein
MDHLLNIDLACYIGHLKLCSNENWVTFICSCTYRRVFEIKFIKIVFTVSLKNCLKGFQDNLLKVQLFSGWIFLPYPLYHSCSLSLSLSLSLSVTYIFTNLTMSVEVGLKLFKHTKNKKFLTWKYVLCKDDFGTTR